MLFVWDRTTPKSGLCSYITHELSQGGSQGITGNEWIVVHA